MTVPKETRLCEFIKINIIIFSANCFPSNTYFYSPRVSALLLSFSVAALMMFVLSFCILLLHNKSVGHLSKWQKVHSKDRYTLYTQIEMNGLERITNGRMREIKSDREMEKEWCSAASKEIFSSIIIEFRISAIVCTLSVVRSFSEFDPENVIKIAIWFLFNGLNTNYTTQCLCFLF